MILAIDVGVKNLAYCAMHKGELQAWANTQLTATTYVPHETVSYVLAFVREHRALLDAAELIVIERQMRVNMRIIEAVLHALFFHKVIVTNPRTVKAKYGLCKRNYRLNKDAAVLWVQTELALRPPCDLSRHFDAAKKKDDLADAYIMARFFSEQEVRQDTKWSVASTTQTLLKANASPTQGMSSVLVSSPVSSKASQNATVDTTSLGAPSP